ncbi:MAG: tRNA dimethylallyltransferase, partial [Actinomycetota bacterium]
IRALIDAGFVDEVAALLRDGFGGWLTATQAIGYAEIARHLAGELTLEEAVAVTSKRTRNLARRQVAWFAKDPRVRWVTVGEGGATMVVDTLQDMLIAVTPSAIRGSI